MKLRPLDYLRRETYLNRFSWHLQNYPGYVKVKREVRRETTATAGEVGMRAALATLGPPRALAGEYLDTMDRPYPRFTAGAFWAAGGIYALTGLALAYSLGTMDTLEQMGGGVVTHRVFGALVKFTYTDAEISNAGRFTWVTLIWVVVAAGLPFLLGSRLWRLWSRRPARPVEAP
jgi:hypothetical protein